MAFFDQILGMQVRLLVQLRCHVSPQKLSGDTRRLATLATPGEAPAAA
jgi:hypothetical protein